MKYIGFLMLIALSGCVTKYKEPLTNNTATIELNHLIKNGYTYLSKAPSMECEFDKDESMGRAGDMINASKQHLVKVEASENLILSVLTSVSGMVSVAPYTFQKQYCLNYINFIPELNHTYSIHQNMPINGVCEVTVIDKATGAPPKNLKSVNKSICLSNL